MASLTSCLAKAGGKMSAEDIALCRQMAGEYAADGMSQSAAAERAVRDLMDIASRDRAQTIDQIGKLNGKLPAASKLTHSVDPTARAASDIRAIIDFNENVAADLWEDKEVDDVPEVKRMLENRIPFRIANDVLPVTNPDHARIIASAIDALVRIPGNEGMFDGINNIGIYGRDNAHANYHIASQAISINRNTLDWAIGSKRARSILMRHLAHEAWHHRDMRGQLYPVSASSQEFKFKPDSFGEGELAGEFGSIMHDVLSLYGDQDPSTVALRNYLDYPLGHISDVIDGKLADDFIETEVFAQLGALYTVAPNLLRRHLPNAYEVFDDIQGNLKDHRNNTGTEHALEPILEALRVSGSRKRLGTRRQSVANQEGAAGGEAAGELEARRGTVPGQRPTQVEGARQKPDSTLLREGDVDLTAYGIQPGGRYNTRDIAAALESWARDAYGGMERNDRSKEAERRIGKWMMVELLHELRNPEKSGAGWYSVKFQEALDTMGEAFPELVGAEIDPALKGLQGFNRETARNLFTAIIAVTSDGQKVMDNYRMAAQIYDQFRKTGKIAITKGHKREASMVRNLGNISQFLEQYGPEGMHTRLLNEKTVSELTKDAKAHGHDFGTDYQAHMTMPYAAVVFGPKLGAFYANLMGSHGYLTMDMWWSRTFNRYRGDLLTKPTRESFDNFKELIGEPDYTDDQVLSAIIGPRNAYKDRNYKTRLAELVGHSEPSTSKGKATWRELAKQKAGDQFEGLLHEHNVERAANTIYKDSFEAIEDAPFNATDRTFMYNATLEAQKMLKRRGQDISIADIQAILWYYEKRLYGDLGARQSADTSYADAAATVAQEFNPDAQAGGRPQGNTVPVGEDVETFTGTIEVNTVKTETGSRAMGVYAQAVAAGDRVAARAMREAISSALRAARLSTTSPFEKMAAAIVGRKDTKVEGIVAGAKTAPYDVAGTFEGDLSQNIRVPLTGMTSTQRSVLLAAIGKAWSQAAMAASRLKTVAIWDPVGEGATRTYSVLLDTQDKLGETGESFVRFATELGEGHEIAVDKIEGGYRIDVMPKFGPDGAIETNLNDVVRALQTVYDGSGVIVPADYQSDYIDSGTNNADYDTIIKEWKRDITNEAVNQIKAATSLNAGRARSYLGGAEEAGLSTEESRRAARVKARLDRRLGDFTEATEIAEGIARELEQKQQQWLDKYAKRFDQQDLALSVRDTQGETTGPFRVNPNTTQANQGASYGWPADSESRYQEAQKGMGDQRTMLARAKDWWTEVIHGMTRHWKALPNNKYFAQAYEWLRRLEQAPEAATTRAVQMLRDITATLETPEDYDLFNRYVILEDMMHDREQGLPLSFGFTRDTLPPAHAAIKRLADGNSAVRSALDKRYEMISEVGDKLVSAGILSEESKNNAAYFRHQVLQYARIWDRAVGPGGKVKDPNATYTRQRRGSQEKDYNANYFEVELGFLQQAFVDMEAVDTIKKIRNSKYNIKAQLSAEELRLAEKEGIEIDGQRYVAWQPSKGNQFFYAKTITERGVDKLLQEALDPVNQIDGVDPAVLAEVLDTIKDQLVMGPKKPSIIIPEELATTMDAFRNDIDQGMFDHVLAKPLRMWKQWVLINPRKVLQYNLNNLSGDLDAVIAGNPHALRQLPRAIKELYQVHMKGGEGSAMYKAALKAGVFNSALSVQEIPDINHFSEFQHLLGKATGSGFVADSPVGKFWRASRNFTAWRENWLRYAAYIDYVERLNAGESAAEIGYGAALPEMVEGLETNEEKAALLARELVGDYGAVSQYGQEIRAKLIPFYSWMEINTKRYKRLFDNALRRGAGQGAFTASVLAAHGVLRMFVLYGLVNLWNNLFFGDDEDELDVTERVRLHLMLGRTDDNELMMLRFQGALSDFLGWVGFDQAFRQVLALDSGRADWNDVMASVAKAPVNKVVGGFTPLIKAPFELATGLSTFPDAFNPRPIRDKVRYAAKLFSAENEYDVLVDNPSRGYITTLPEVVAKKRHAGELSYYRARSMATEWNNKRTGHEGTSLHTSPRSEFYRKYKLALKYGDMDAVKHFREELANLGVKNSDMKKSMRAAHPLAPIPMKERSAFKRSLTDREREILDSAIGYYNDIYL